MIKFSKRELQEMLLDTISVYKKLYYSNSHEYFTEPDAEEKIFTGKDAKKMNKIIKRLGIDK